MVSVHKMYMKLLLFSMYFGYFTALTTINVAIVIAGFVLDGLGCDSTALGKYWYLSAAETSFQSILILFFAVKNIKLLRNLKNN